MKGRSDRCVMYPFASVLNPLARLNGKYLPLMVRGVKYALPYRRVLARGGMGELLSRPDLPDLVAGVITRRGRLIPVLELPDSPASVAGSVPPIAVTILVVQSCAEDNPMLPVGLCVDQVFDPVTLSGDDFKPELPCDQDPALPCLASVPKLGLHIIDFDRRVSRALFSADRVAD